FGNKLGHFVCPILAGVLWDLFGPWGGFGVTFAWAVLFWAAALMLPESGTVRATSEAPAVSLRDMLPRLEDYTRTFRLLAVPLVAVAVAGSVLNIAVSAI